MRFSLRKWQVIRQASQPPSPPPEHSTPAVEVVTPGRSEHLLDARESIQVIAQCMLTGQVELSEGCLRIKVLLDHLSPDWAQDERLVIFETVYEQLKDFPTHSARKAQTKQETFRQDKQRWKIEDDNKEALLSAARVLMAELS
ncbi:MAG: DUF2489 domain-containing protein [Gammaproteobacteria bacterium]|nr:MAG: DUF2489 domain-containing protein [Gammaproteobacteria bacterium]